METYIITIEDTGSEYVASAYVAYKTEPGIGEPIAAAARAQNIGLAADTHDAYEAGRDALAAVMPDPETREIH